MTDKNLPWFRSLLELTLPDGEEPSPGNDPNDSRISIDTGSTDSTYATEMIPDFTTPLTGPSDNNKNIFSIPPNKIPVKDRLKVDDIFVKFLQNLLYLGN
jgi:hypothetical protein